MKDKIFEIENGKVVINENILLIPYLKAIVDKYEDYINALSFVKFYTDISGPYSDFDEEAKRLKLVEDFPGDYKPTDLEMCVAMERLEEVWRKEPTLHFFHACRTAIRKMANYMENVQITDDKENKNVGDVQKTLDKCLTTIRNFRNTEKLIEEEVLKTRGNKEISYDL